MAYRPPLPEGPLWWRLTWPLLVVLGAVAAEAVLDRWEWAQPVPWEACAKTCHRDGLVVHRVAAGECVCLPRRRTRIPPSWRDGPTPRRAM